VRRHAVGILCVAAAGALTLGAGCAATRPDAPAEAEAITPADLVASIADVAAGRNPAMAEAGLVLKQIEFRLSVGTTTKAGGRIEVLLLDAETSRQTETSFLQQFTLRVPEARRKGAAERPLVPGVRDFVDAAMNTARDLARATAEAGAPQRVRSVELTAKITRSRRGAGGITARIPAWVRPSAGAEAARAREEENVVRLIFEAAPAD
jgi:hypothetical protein